MAIPNHWLHAVTFCSIFIPLLADPLDEILKRTSDISERLTDSSCSTIPNLEKMLPRNAVSDLPLPFEPQGGILDFRAQMYEAQRLAVNRAIFYSFALQNSTKEEEPNLSYYLFSTLATLSASDEHVVGSRVVFSRNSLKVNWFGKPNETLERFGPYSFRSGPNRFRSVDLAVEDYEDDMQHSSPNPWYAAWLSDRAKGFLPQSVALEMRVLKDQGKPDSVRFSGPPVDLPAIWTMPFFDCGYSNRWLVSAISPIVDVDEESNNLNRNILENFQHTRQKRQDVATHQLPPEVHAAINGFQSVGKYIASVSIDIDYNKIDINQCDGDVQFNAFAGTHLCKNTTMCEPTNGHGFRRGGYKCVCRPGYRLPEGQIKVWDGVELESAEKNLYNDPTNYQCVEIQDPETLIPPIAQAAMRQAINLQPQQFMHGMENNHDLSSMPFPNMDMLAPNFAQEFNIPEMQHHNEHGPKLESRMAQPLIPGMRVAANPMSQGPSDSPQSHFQHADSPRALRAKRQAPQPGHEFNSPNQESVDNGPSLLERLMKKLEQEDNMMHKIRRMLDSLTPQNCSNRQADDTRIDLGLSGTLKKQMAKQFAPQARIALRLAHFLSNYLQNTVNPNGESNILTETLIRAEMAAVIVAEPTVGSMAVAFEEGVFPGKKYYSPTALYNKVLDELQFYQYSDNYTSSAWYKNAKGRISGTKLKQYIAEGMVPSDSSGQNMEKISQLSYAAVAFEDVKEPVGPFFDCFYLEKFAYFEVPFFTKVNNRLRLAGFVTIGINPEFADVNQCAGSDESLFQGTDRCDRETTLCFPTKGRGLRAGGYKCECKDGYEYPYDDGIDYFDGMRLEMEYHNKLVGLPNNFKNYRCRHPGTLLKPTADFGSRPMPPPQIFVPPPPQVMPPQVMPVPQVPLHPQMKETPPAYHDIDITNTRPPHPQPPRAPLPPYIIKEKLDKDSNRLVPVKVTKPPRTSSIPPRDIETNMIPRISRIEEPTAGSSGIFFNVQLCFLVPLILRLF